MLSQQTYNHSDVAAQAIKSDVQQNPLGKFSYLSLLTGETKDVNVKSRHPSVSKNEASKKVNDTAIVTAQAHNTAISQAKEADLSIVKRSLTFMAQSKSLIQAMQLGDAPIDEVFTGYSEGVRTRFAICHQPKPTGKQDALGNAKMRNRYFIVSETTTEADGKRMSVLGEQFSYTKADAIAYLRTLKVLNDSYIVHDIRDTGGFGRTKAQRQSIDRSYVISRLVGNDKTYFDGDRKQPQWVSDIRLAKRYALEQAYRTSKHSGGAYELIA